YKRRLMIGVLMISNQWLRCTIRLLTIYILCYQYLAVIVPLVNHLVGSIILIPLLRNFLSVIKKTIKIRKDGLFIYHIRQMSRLKSMFTFCRRTLVFYPD